jgi:hypothetical protein
MRYLTIGGATPAPRRVSALALGAMRFGTATEEPTAFAILDHFLAAGGNFIDTANNYAWWHDGGRGGQSEALLGRWRGSRGLTDEVVIATKVGARPTRAGINFADRMASDEGLSPEAIQAAVRESRERLGVERLDLLYAHVEDPRVYEVLQYHRSYLQHRTDLASPRSAFGDPGLLTADLFDYVTAETGLVAVAFSPLLEGAYTRPDKTPGEAYAAAGNAAGSRRWRRSRARPPPPPTRWCSPG